jgi:hypothetical protein
MGRPEFDPAASDEPLYSTPDAGTDYLYASGHQPERLTEGFIGGQVTDGTFFVNGSGPTEGE